MMKVSTLVLVLLIVLVTVLVLKVKTPHGRTQPATEKVPARKQIPLGLRFRQWLANRLLKDVHLFEVKFGTNSVTMSDVIIFDNVTAPDGAGEIGMVSNVLKFYDGSQARDLVSKHLLMLLDGTQAMTADMNMGSHNIGSVGTVDGVDVSAIKLNSMPSAADGPIACNSQRLTGVADGVSDTDAATKGQVDAAKEGISVKDSVRVRAQGNVNLANELENGDTLDGVVLATGDRVLCDQQTTGTEDGIYIVPASGAASRSDDFAVGDHVAGAFTFVCEGTDADAGFVCTNDKGSDVVGTDALTFSQFSGAGSIVARYGLSKTGNNIDADYGAPNLTLGTANAAGTQDTALMRVDATVALFNDGANPETIDPDDAAATGTDAVAARRDHQHAVTCAAPGTNVTPEAGNSEGSASSFARSDHMHNLPSGAAGTIEPDDAAAEGVAASFARTDHQHAIVCAAPIQLQPDASQAEGTATSFARSDHGHQIDCAAPSSNLTVSSGNAEGSASSFARSDHSHAITSSSNPGANARILASDGSGFLTLKKIIIDAAAAADAVMPGTGGQGKVGSAASKWEEVNAVTVNSGDYGFCNGWRATEVWEDDSEGHQGSEKGLVTKGLAFLNEKGERMFWIDAEGNMRLKGKIIQEA